MLQFQATIEFTQDGWAAEQEKRLRSKAWRRWRRAHRRTPNQAGPMPAVAPSPVREVVAATEIIVQLLHEGQRVGSPLVCYTDARGWCELQVSAGPYDVAATAPGTQTWRRRALTVRPGETLRLEMRLVDGEVEEMICVGVPRLGSTSTG